MDGIEVHARARLRQGFDAGGVVGQRCCDSFMTALRPARRHGAASPDFVRKELAQRAPDVIACGQHAAADRQTAPLEFVAQAPHFRVQRARRAGQGFDIADIVEQAASSDSALVGGAAVFAEVFAVRGIEQVDIVCAGIDSRRTMSSARRKALEAMVPPMPLTWKNSPRENSQAWVVWAIKRVSTLAYLRRMPCSAKKKKDLASLRSSLGHAGRHVDGEQDDRAGAGPRRATSWRKRRSSLVNGTGSACTARRLMASLTVRRRSRRERAPRLSQPSRTNSTSSTRLPGRGLRSGSLSSSHSQSMTSSIENSSSRRTSPSPRRLRPCRRHWRRNPRLRHGCSTSPSLPSPWPAPRSLRPSARRKRACSSRRTGTCTCAAAGRK
jgi:hypothetical protein